MNMKKFIVMVCLGAFIGIPAFSEEENRMEFTHDSIDLETGAVYSEAETRMDLSFYASTQGEMHFNFVPQWTFPFLQGNHPMTSGNNVTFRLDAGINPIWAGLTGNTIISVAPFLNFRLGAMVGTGWNYDIGRLSLVGLGLNRKTGIHDPITSEVVGNGLDGVVWDVHAGAMLQFDLAALFPGDWNHVVMQYYNQIEYLAYSKAQEDAFWYYMNDEGINQNAFRYKFEFFIGYMMPIFLDLVGFQLEGTLPFYNFEAGTSVRDRGYSFTNAFIANFKINNQWSIMTIVPIANSFIDPDKNGYEREWVFGGVHLIANWRIK